MREFTMHKKPNIIQHALVQEQGQIDCNERKAKKKNSAAQIYSEFSGLSSHVQYSTGIQGQVQTSENVATKKRRT